MIDALLELFLAVGWFPVVGAAIVGVTRWRDRRRQEARRGS